MSDKPQAERTCGECACFFANKNWCGQSGTHALRTRIANDCRSFVPTQPPPVAGDCTSCGGPVLHRDGAPGEYDHDCSPRPSPAPGKDAGRCDPGCRHWSEPEGNPACSACDGVTDNYEPAPGKHPPISVSDGRGGEVDLSPLVKPAPAPEPKRERLNPDPLERLSPDREQALRNEAATYTYSLAACCVREIDALRSDRDRLAAENERLRGDVREQAETVSNLRCELASSRGHGSDLKADLSEARRQLEEAQRGPVPGVEVRVLASEVLDLRKQFAERDRLYKSSCDWLNEKDGEIHALKLQLAERDEQIARLTRAGTLADNICAQCEYHGKHAKAQAARIEQLERELSDVRNRLRDEAAKEPRLHKIADHIDAALRPPEAAGDEGAKGEGRGNG
jgi:hypothetical protein